jgi:hypothetical protein
MIITMRLFRLFKYAKYVKNCLLLFNGNFSINAKSITSKQNYSVYFHVLIFYIFMYYTDYKLSSVKFY